ncbi:MAG: RES domain-containing protein [Mycobacteriales bacterium]
MSRPALADPSGDLSRFPRWRLGPQRLVYRAHRRERGPWWFASGSAGRFDLESPRGTCYLAATPEAAFRERWGRKLADQRVITASEADETVVSTLHVPQRVALADMRSRRAVDFGVTREISTIVPYAKRQAWAGALADAGHGGIRYDARFSTAPSAVSYAVFGDGGAAAGASDATPTSGRGAAEAAHVLVVNIPAVTAISILDPSDQDRRDQRDPA